MVVTSTDFLAEVIYFVKNDFLSNITDPKSGSRRPDSQFIMTSYPQRQVDYPLITIRALNQTATRTGMQTTAMVVDIILEVRVWARNQKEKDNLGNAIYKRLRDIQFTAVTGSIVANLHNFRLLSSVEINEDGDGTPKSRILQVGYTFHDI